MPLVQEAHFDSPFIATSPEPRATPDQSLVPVEFESVSELPTDFKRGVGFSGGNDSLVATHKAMSEGLADFVIHIDTGTNISETVSWVRRTCERHGWPLIIAPTTINPERWFCRYGPPDSRAHNSAFWALKGRALNQISKQIGEFEFITGVYKRESQKRIENVDGEYSDPEYCNWAYRNIVWNWIDTTFEDYIEQHGLTRSPVKNKIHRSGDCQCLAYGHRDEIYVDIESKYPRDFEFLRNVERRLQEYRGRLLLVEDEYPDVYQQARDEWRKEEGKPYKTLDETLAEYAPDVFAFAERVSKEAATRRGRMIASNYFGHGKLSDAETHGLVQQAEVEAGNQADLCEYGCGVESDSRPRTVQRAVEQARTEGIK